MKKIQLIILLAITFCNSFAQQLHEIKLFLLQEIG